MCIESWHIVPKICRAPLGVALVVLSKLGHTRPRGLGGSAERLEDEEELVDFAVAREEGSLGCELSHDAPETPDIDGGPVVLLTEEDFRGPVPEGDDLASVGVEGDVEGAG